MAPNVPASGPAGGIFADEVFTQHREQVTIFVPCNGPVRPLGRVASELIPAVELAVIEHSGPPANVDRTYGTRPTLPRISGGQKDLGTSAFDEISYVLREMPLG